ncbi:hypothetical protein [Pelosinus sp. IPA-1]|uniref:hypothetical protein n=1 Tax=Pelosinus sp. IPA-1 TaxID=3029569 RepID=UPI00243619B9|nr:hypothetical protein [Pelosinus sp. IPA-1]GMB00896.1 hypothetical protein PIPA1_36950 [Pelosinus sp. IPA-1]
MKIVQIAFRGNYAKLYDYFTDLDLSVGEPVVCETGSGYSIGTVAGFIPVSKNAKAWIVQKIDVEGHKQRQELRELLE